MADSWTLGAGATGGDEEEGGALLPPFAEDPLGVLRRRWLWMLLCVLLGTVATLFALSLRRPTYVAETTIVISSQAIPEEFVRSTVTEDSLSHVNAIVGQVLARQNLAGLVEKYGLYEEARANVPLATVIASMREDIDIYPQKSMNPTRGGPSSQIFVIAFQYPDPQVAADVANELAGLFTEANIEMRNRQAQLTTDFLRREMKRSEQELRDHEHKITQFLQANRGGLPGELDANIAKLERLQNQRQNLATQIDAAESRLMLLNSQPDPKTTGPTSRSLLADLRKRLEEQLVILTEEHPNVIALRRRIDRLEAEVTNEESSPAGPSERALQVRAEQLHLANLRDQQQEVEASIGGLDAQLEKAPMRQEEFSALEQRATVLRENYLQFLRKVQEAELAQSLESAQHGARVAVLDRAAPPTEQKHARWKLATAGAFASVLASVVLAVLLELLDAVVVTRDQLEALTDRPLLGSIPRVA